MLNKKCLFGGGLYLVNIIAIFVSISSNVIARESIHNFRSELNQIYWEADCSQREDEIQHYDYNKAYQDDNKHRWILDKYYEESRTRIIGKTIGDCVADKGYFEHKKADDIITFENTCPELYERKNWNAVILYNYVHEAINRNGPYEDENTYFDDMSNVSLVLQGKLETIKTHYEKYYRGYIKRKHIKKDDADKLIVSLQGNLDDAVKDIQKYVDALKLNIFLQECRNEKLEYNKKQYSWNLAPCLEDTSSSKVATFSRPLVLTDEESEKFYLFYPTIACDNNQLYIAKLGLQNGEWKQSNNGQRSGGQRSMTKTTTRKVTKIRNLTKFKNDYGSLLDRLLKRLDGLVKLPTEELWNKWHLEEEKMSANEEENGEENI